MVVPKRSAAQPVFEALELRNDPHQVEVREDAGGYGGGYGGGGYGSYDDGDGGGWGEDAEGWADEGL